MKFESSAARALLALAVVFLGVQTASAELPAGGTVFLDLGTVDQFRWVKPDNSVKTQFVADMRTITGDTKDSNKLALGLPQLMTLTSPGKTVGFNSQKNWIGIREQKGGVETGRVVSGQSITLGLGSELSGYNVRHTELWVNAKKNAVIRAVLSSGGQTQTFALRTGLSATPPFRAGPGDQDCFPGVSDSSPDSAANCKWVFNGQWDSVTFITDAGEWSLASGATSSRFDLIQFSGVLGCPTIGNQNIAEIQGANGLSSSGVRLENVFDPLLPNEPVPVCVVVPYSYSPTCPAGANPQLGAVCTNFIYEFLNQGTHMAFFFQTNWPPEPVPTNGGFDAIPETVQLFINGSTTPVVVDACPEIRPLFDDNGTPDDLTDDVFLGIDPAHPPADQEPTVPGTQAGCLITDETIHNGATVEKLQGIYVQGDWTAGRGGFQ
jgi:hypothetical protein